MEAGHDKNVLSGFKVPTNTKTVNGDQLAITDYDNDGHNQSYLYYA